MANNVNTVSNAQWVEQELAAKLDYSQKWPELLTPGDSILTSDWQPTAGATLTSGSVSGAVTSIFAEFSAVGVYRLTNVVTTAMGRRDSRTILVVVSDSSGSAPVRSALFYRDEFLARFRSDRLPGVLRYLGGPVSDDFLWGKLKAAEADIQRELHIFLVPTVLFPNEPTQAEIAALNGAPWAVDPGYDYDADMTQPGGWTFVALRQKPVISLASIKFVYPSTGTIFEVQPQWIKLDKKYGHVRFIPAGSGFTHQMGAPIVGAMGLQTAPQFVEIRYTAGLTNAAADYPDLIDLVQRMVLLRILGDAMPAASGSISADGLSQSISPPDTDKLQAEVDRMLETLRQRIHGVPLMVL